MRADRIASALGMLLLAGSAQALAPLAERVTAAASEQGAGAVVVAERSDGKWLYALGGKPFAGDSPSVAPEQVVFEIGSISKVFTGLLLAHAVHEKKLALSDTLAQRLSVKFVSTAVGAITLEQLATHTSCLPRLPANMLDLNAKDPYASYDDAALFAYLASANIDALPPCVADYSNLGFGILGVVLERTYGKSWAALVHDKISVPLKMTDTAQVLDKAVLPRFAAPYDGKEAASTWTFQSMAGAGALRSTSADMAKFADALLAGAKGPLKAVWPIFGVQHAKAPMFGGGIGLGLMLGKQDGETSYWHNGGTGGFRSDLRVFPASGRATVILASNAQAQPERWLSEWQRGDRPLPAPTFIEVAPAALTELVGVYTIAPQARFTVLKVGEELRVRLTGQPFYPVYATDKDTFVYKVVEAKLVFQRDKEGKVSTLVLHQNGREMPAQRSVEAAPKFEFPSAEALREYVGEYDFSALAADTALTIKEHDGVLFAQLSGQGPAPIFCIGKDNFEWDIVVAGLTFERDDKGRIVAAVLHQNGADTRALRK